MTAVSARLTVTIPTESGVTDRAVPKSTVPAVPTVDPLFFTAIPDPVPVTPVKPEPSPTKEFAVTTPVALI